MKKKNKGNKADKAKKGNVQSTSINENVTSDSELIRLKLLKQFGSNSIVTGSDLEKATFGRISTGSISLDLALGGGVPIGRAMQVSGAKSTCKSTLCDHIAKNAQELTVEWVWTERREEKGREIVKEHPRKVDNLLCGYIDVEGTQDVNWLKKVGVNTNSWLYHKPSGQEEALNMAHAMQLQGVNVIFLDSIDALEPTLYYETQAGDSMRMGVKQQQLGEFLRKYTATNNKLEKEGKLPCTLVLLNQLREKIGAYGDPEYTPGGRAIEFYVSIDLRLRRGDWISIGKGEDKMIIGQTVKFKAHKNKTYRQQQTGEFDFYFDDTDRVQSAHIDNAKEIVIEGICWGVIERAGAWFKYKGDNLAQGSDNTVDFLLENEDVFEQVKSDLFTLVAQDVNSMGDGSNEE